MVVVFVVAVVCKHLIAPWYKERLVGRMRKYLDEQQQKIRTEENSAHDIVFVGKMAQEAEPYLLMDQRSTMKDIQIGRNSKMVR